MDVILQKDDIHFTLVIHISFKYSFKLSYPKILKLTGLC